MMKEIFERYLGKMDLLEIYLRNSPNFKVGRVLGLDDDFVLLHALSKYGRDEGLILCALESIVGVQVDTRYLKKTLCLSKNYTEQRHLPEVNGGDMLGFLLNYARENELGISLELIEENPEDYCGIVLDCNDDVVTLKQIGLYGEDDGIAYVRCDEIERVDCDDQEMNCRIFFALHNAQL